MNGDRHNPAQSSLSLVHIGAKYYVVCGILVLISLWGVYVWTLQATEGLGLTSMNMPAYWGLYIANFVLFIGLSAGGIAVASLSHAVGIEKFKPIGRIAEVVAISCLCLAGIFIFVDMGRPDRFLFVFKYGRVQSPLIWDVTVITVYFALCLGLLYFSLRQDLVRLAGSVPKLKWLYISLTLGYTDLSERARRRDRRLLKVLAVISIPGFVALHSVTAWIMGVLKAQPGWHTSILAPLFVASALVSGLAVVIVAVLFTKYFFKLHIDNQIVKDLGKILAFLIPVLLYFLFSEFLTVSYADEPSHMVVIKEIISGSYAPIFWFDIVIGLIAPMIILALPWTRTVAGVGIASLLVVVGVFAERINIVLPPLLHNLLPYPEGRYSPTWVEWSIMLGAYAGGVLIFLLMGRFMPLIHQEEESELGGEPDGSAHESRRTDGRRDEDESVAIDPSGAVSAS